MVLKFRSFIETGTKEEAKVQAGYSYLDGVQSIVICDVDTEKNIRTVKFLTNKNTIEEININGEGFLINDIGNVVDSFPAITPRQEAPKEVENSATEEIEEVPVKATPKSPKTKK